MVPLPGDTRFASRPIYVSSLNEIIEIDPVARTCVAEPGVTFEEIVRRTLRVGLLPKVVPELKGITLGGAVSGCSIESMSYRYGGFHDSCLEYEVITGDGRILACSREEDPFVFGMMHGSYGTLGILSKLTFSLVEAAPFVHMTYRRVEDPADFFDDLRSVCDSGEFDFVDAIAHGPREFVLCLGRFEEQAPYTSSYTGTEIFYRSTRMRGEDHLSTFDYCFRYDTEAHWLTDTIPPLTWRPVRRAIGRWFLGSTNLIRWSRRLAPVLRFKKRPDVVVDVFIPSRRFLDFNAWYEREIAFYPLWLIPYRTPERYPWLDDAYHDRIGDDLFVDCAVYGARNNSKDVDLSKVLEDATFEHDGIKTLISRNHYDAGRFWTIYNRSNYEAAKQALDPGGTFPGLFEKLHRVE